MKFFLIVIFFAESLFVSCSPLHTVSDITYRFNPTPKTVYGNEDVDIWISEFDFSNHCNSQNPCKSREDTLAAMLLPFSADSFWEPSKKDLKPLKKGLKKALRNNRWKNLSNRPGTFREYSYAFLGVNYGDEKFIEIAASRCNIMEECEIISPMRISFGSGKDFFSVSYDVSNNELSEFTFGTYH